MKEFAMHYPYIFSFTVISIAIVAKNLMVGLTDSIMGNRRCVECEYDIDEKLPE